MSGMSIPCCKEHLDCDVLPIFIQPPIKLHVLNGKGWRVTAVRQWHLRQHLQVLVLTISMQLNCMQPDCFTDGPWEATDVHQAAVPHLNVAPAEQCLNGLSHQLCRCPMQEPRFG